MLVSDAGGQMAAEPDPDHDWGRHLFRVLERDRQPGPRAAQAPVRRGVHARGEREGAYWGIRSDIADFGLADALPAPHAATMALATLSTRLARLDDVVQERLINWGYAACDAGLRAHVDPRCPPRPPIPIPRPGSAACERARRPAAALPAAPALRLERAVLRRQRRRSGPTTPATSCGARDGTLLARAPDALARPARRDGSTPTAARSRPSDFISDPRRDYRAQYVKLRVARPDLRNRVYGHAVEDNGRLWLQYWLWYFYNDYSLALGAGLHEGDWEMVQFRMHGDEPDVAVYAQHVYAEKRRGPTSRRTTATPVVYVARGSHASYFEAGFHTTEAWYDLADGKRKSPELTLEILDGDGPGWARWRGRWGDTQPRLPGGLQQPSPTGPGAKAQWSAPDTLLDKAITPRAHTPAEAPEVTIARNGDWMRITFDFERHDPPPRSLIVTVNSRDEAGVPPRTYTFSLEDTGSGTLNTRIPTDPAKHYDVYTSTSAGDPPVPSESTLTLLDPVGEAKHPVLQGVAQGLGKVFAWIRGHLKRGGP